LQLEWSLCYKHQILGTSEVCGILFHNSITNPIPTVRFDAITCDPVNLILDTPLRLGLRLQLGLVLGLGLVMELSY